MADLNYSQIFSQEEKMTAAVEVKDSTVRPGEVLRLITSNGHKRLVTADDPSEIRKVISIPRDQVDVEKRQEQPHTVIKKMIKVNGKAIAAAFVLTPLEESTTDSSKPRYRLTMLISRNGKLVNLMSLPDGTLIELPRSR